MGTRRGAVQLMLGPTAPPALCGGRPGTPLIPLLTSTYAPISYVRSGEFHMYRASRRREQERMARIEEEAKRSDAQREFEEERARLAAADEERTNKKRAKRQKKKAR